MNNKIIDINNTFWSSLLICDTGSATLAFITPFYHVAVLNAGDCFRDFHVFGAHARPNTSVWKVCAAQQMVSYKVLDFPRVVVVAAKAKQDHEADDRTRSWLRHAVADKP